MLGFRLLGLVLLSMEFVECIHCCTYVSSGSSGGNVMSF
ncbi:hypothetical protein KC19_2G081500 [Ceratodon purpureus]|uniref:Uncharacterized protein n=1 Tax=Ceratodon purpureus TaxID=3225 RepID=A0A8T0IT25_CERPU|nr:hypothetical protein KC19_2G081500 [Ceratodon purpureus]